MFVFRLPKERIPSTTNNIQLLSTPSIKHITIINVDIAIEVSEIAISVFLLYLSAQTPANIDINICGKNAQRVDIVVITPDPVVSVMYQIIAYCTIDEPNSDIA